MDNNNNKSDQGKSMFLYTALIFLVALILILVAFFGNLKRPKNANEVQPTPIIIEDTSSYEAAKETISDLEAQLKTYSDLLKANSYINSESYDEAEIIINSINADSLTEDEKILYDNITTKINEGKEQ